jgi:hypothetical protein
MRNINITLFKKVTYYLLVSFKGIISFWHRKKNPKNPQNKALKDPFWSILANCMQRRSFFEIYR